MTRKDVTEITDRLIDIASRYASHAYVPYSEEKSACVLVLTGGGTVPGVRVENASFSLTMPALLNAWTSATAIGRRDVSGVVFNRKIDVDDARLWSALVRAEDSTMGAQHIVRSGADLPDDLTPLIRMGHASGGLDEEVGVALARKAAETAHVPASRFPVGCVAVMTDGAYVSGCNVENRDWTHILCAERNAVGTAVTLGRTDFRHIYVSAPRDAYVSPCGSCRQVLVELAPGVPVTLDRGDGPAETFTPEELLPGWFSGERLRKQR